jgi:hypothetical protein
MVLTDVDVVSEYRAVLMVLTDVVVVSEYRAVLMVLTDMDSCVTQTRLPSCPYPRPHRQGTGRDTQRAPLLLPEGSDGYVDECKNARNRMSLVSNVATIRERVGGQNSLKRSKRVGRQNSLKRSKRFERGSRPCKTCRHKRAEDSQHGKHTSQACW